MVRQQTNQKKIKKSRFFEKIADNEVRIIRQRATKSLKKPHKPCNLQTHIVNVQYINEIKKSCFSFF